MMRRDGIGRNLRQFVVRLWTSNAMAPNRPEICAALGVLRQLCPRHLRMLVVGKVVVVVQEKQADGFGHDEIPCAVVRI